MRRWLLIFGPGTRDDIAWWTGWGSARRDRHWRPLAPWRCGFDSAGPTIWVEGRIVGGWAQRPSGEIAVRLLEKVDTETARMIDAEAARLAAWLGPTRIRWPFP